MIAADVVRVPVRGGDLTVAQWGAGPDVVLALHGITASHAQFPPVVDRLPDGVRVIAPDLRGRGGSAGLPGPWGMSQHVQDCVAALDHLAVERALLLAVSMGGFVGTLFAARHPDRTRALVLVDGGTPFTLPEGTDVDMVLEATLGPSIQRLSQTFPSREAYHDFWRQHPALGEDWSPYVEHYLDHDVEGPHDALRSKVSPEAIRADGRDLYSNTELKTCLADIACPVLLVRAPRGLLNQPQPTIPDELVADMRAAIPHLRDEMVEDVNHYTLAMGERGAAHVAQRVVEELAAS
ncbi:MAG TPA: alpha/beta hydrolase [Actinomycetota bacterium]|nr:alpha/beta hydrolase [Actinomycetota bacterium]